ncbi:MAG: methyltransferase domain-containing protein [Anaerolineae bacterium]|nr:methyltransferase domain-containing protein [Anaerolineae bacterium]
MAKKQQIQTLDYFKKHAGEWKEKAASDSERRFNVIKYRNQYVLDVVASRAATRSVLDVGCGTGDLVCDIAGMGIPATGLDFSDEMIDLAQKEASQRNLPTADFICQSIFDYDFSSNTFDVIAANGFIEYISYDERDRFFELAYQGLNPGGSLVVGSRNRLFNLFSLNSYTEKEISQGTAAQLLAEAVAIAAAPDITQLADLETAPLQPMDTEHTDTGIGVTTRYQYTPVQLMRLLNARGFSVRQIFPVHIHGVNPAFKGLHPEVHFSIAMLLQDYGYDHPSLIPYSSTFMVHAFRE